MQALSRPWELVACPPPQVLHPTAAAIAQALRRGALAAQACQATTTDSGSDSSPSLETRDNFGACSLLPSLPTCHPRVHD